RCCGHGSAAAPACDCPLPGLRGASEVAAPAATPTGRSSYAHPYAAADAARIRISIAGAQADAEGEASLAGALEVIAHREPAALAGPRVGEDAPADAGLEDLQIDGDATRREGTTHEPAAELGDTVGADVLRAAHRDARGGAHRRHR